VQEELTPGAVAADSSTMLDKQDAFLRIEAEVRGMQKNTVAPVAHRLVYSPLPERARARWLDILLLTPAAHLVSAPLGSLFPRTTETTPILSQIRESPLCPRRIPNL
jgi:hypothetical protein